MQIGGVRLNVSAIKVYNTSMIERRNEAAKHTKRGGHRVLVLYCERVNVVCLRKSSCVMEACNRKYSLPSHTLLYLARVSGTVLE